VVEEVVVVPPNCVGPKCVYQTRVLSSASYALRLLFASEFTVSRLRSIAPIPAGQGRSLPARMRRLLLDVLDHLPAPPDTVVDGRLRGLPKPAVEHVKSRIRSVLSDPAAYIRRVHATYRPPVGWRVVEESSDAMLVEPRWAWYMVEYMTSVAGAGVDVALCGPDECYPLPLGLYPSRSLVGLAYDLGMLPVLEERMEKYGALTVADAIDSLDVSAAAITLYPKRGGPRATLFLLVPSPQGDAARIAEMQAEAARIEEEMLRAKLGGENALDDARISFAVEEALKEEGLI